MRAESLTGSVIRLQDGRRLGYAQIARSSGPVVLYFHGHPGSRLEVELLRGAGERLGVSLIGVDRPGLGLSDFQPRRQIVDWPDDVVELAVQLRLERFSVLGFSGGGPYALACAARIPERLTGCAVVAGVGTVSGLLAFLGSWMPYLMLPVARRQFFRDPDRARASLCRLAGRWSEPDRRILEVPAIAEAFAGSILEAFRAGTRGAALDGTLIAGSWGIDLEAIRASNIQLWHGELDREIPVASARALAGRLARHSPHFLSDEGHMSLLINRGDEILTSLVQPAT